jgi:zinc transport system substrate-binding protein
LSLVRHPTHGLRSQKSRNFALGRVPTTIRPVHIVRFFAVLVFASALCGAEKRPRVITSFLPLYCWAVNVAGDHATVENLLPPRAEPHEYAFTPGDARKLSSADLILINGLGFESWITKWAGNAPSGTNKLVAATAGLDAELLYGDYHHHHEGEGRHAGHEQPNEHVWLDPLLAAHAVTNILVALQQLDPAHATAYASNAQAYIARLNALHGEIYQTLAGITNRAIVTYHDAFPYFAKRYNLEIAGVVERIPEVNPTPKYLSQLGRTMREHGIGVIAVPPGGRSRLAKQIASDLRVKLIELDTLETGTPSPSAYEERMRHNAAMLREHLK